MAEPVQLDMSTAEPIASVKIDMSTAQPIDSSRPGFVARASQQFGLSQHPIDQLIGELQRLKNDPTGTLWQAIQQPVIGLRDLAYNLVTNPRQTLQGISGGPQFAEDVANKNWSGAAGTLAGGAAQVAAGKFFYPGTTTEQMSQSALRSVPMNAPSPASVPTRDIVAKSPGELQRLQAVGARASQPTVLPSESRGLSLPAAASEPTAAATIPTGPSTVPRVLSGESVLNDTLTTLDNKSLLKIARSRGVDVSREAQLKPGVADVRIIRKIVDSFEPEELQDISDLYQEITRMPQPPAGSAEAWHVRVLKQFFPDISIPGAMLKRAEKARMSSLADLLGGMR